MDYEVVTLQEKTVVGVSDKTGNSDPKMGAIIGELWRKLYQDGISQQIQNRVNEYAIGLYSDYEGEQYSVTVGHEVSQAENDNLVKKVIPAGNYAKFSVHGDMQKAVAQSWEAIWQMNLDRSYTGDFEEYLNCVDGVADINLYIALKD